jgi:hypothetical protein
MRNKPAASATLTAAEATKTPIALCPPPVSIRAAPIDEAAELGALVGPSQVAARAVEMAIARFHHPIWTKVASTSLVAAGLAALWMEAPFVPLALALYGAGIGLESIARGTLPLAVFGPERFRSSWGASPCRASLLRRRQRG